MFGAIAVVSPTPAYVDPRRQPCPLGRVGWLVLTRWRGGTQTTRALPSERESSATSRLYSEIVWRVIALLIDYEPESMYARSPLLRRSPSDPVLGLAVNVGSVGF